MLAVRVASGLPASCVVSKQKACPVLSKCCRSRHLARTICMSQDAQQLLPTCTEVNQHPGLSDYDTPRDNDEPAVKVDFYAKHKLSLNKWRLKCEFDAWGVPEERRVLMVAMAMQESRHMDVEERDRTKDRQCPPDNLACNHFMDNATIFNLSKDLIQKTGYYSGHKGQFQYLTDAQFNHLCTGAGLHDAVGILSWAFDLWGIEDTLVFVRLGGDAFDPFSDRYRQLCQEAPNMPHWRGYCQYMQKSPAVFAEVDEYLSCIKRMLRYIDENPELMWDGKRPDIICGHV